MSMITGTQEFMREHLGHNLGFSEVATYDNIYSGVSIEELMNGSLVVVTQEVERQEFVEATGTYLSCSDCKVEREINIWEADVDWSSA